MSRYTLAMERCLGRIDCAGTEAPDSASVQPLMNLVQGRMLEYLADRICRLFSLSDPDTRTRIATALLGVFCEEFFALFRARAEESPHLAITIARSICRGEAVAGADCGQAMFRGQADLLFPAIFHKHFEYRNLDALLDLVSSDADIQCIILLSRLKQLIGDRAVYRRIEKILCNDSEGICSTVFMRYLREDRIGDLVELVRSGTWKSEMAQVRSQIRELCGD